MTERSNRCWWQQDAVLGWMLGAGTTANVVVALASSWWWLTITAVLFAYGIRCVVQLARATQACDTAADDLIDFYEENWNKRLWGNRLN